MSTLRSCHYQACVKLIDQRISEGQEYNRDRLQSKLTLIAIYSQFVMGKTALLTYGYAFIFQSVTTTTAFAVAVFYAGNGRLEATIRFLFGDMYRGQYMTISLTP